MNKEQCRRVSEAVALLNRAQAIIADVGMEERDKFDGMPEGLQKGEKGQAIEEAADRLEEAADAIETAAVELADYEVEL
jgi:hypothetical protein